MHESPKNKKENEFQNDKEEINNQEEEKIINNISYENKSNEKCHLYYTKKYMIQICL